VANRYYLADLGTNPATKNQRVNFLRGLLPNGPTRTATQALLHWAEAVGGRYYLAQAETSAAEHTSLTGQAWITAFANVAAVETYKSANASLWYPSP
jgi:hypothetical protein